MTIEFDEDPFEDAARWALDKPPARESRTVNGMVASIAYPASVASIGPWAAIEYLTACRMSICEELGVDEKNRPTGANAPYRSQQQRGYVKNRPKHIRNCSHCGKEYETFVDRKHSKFCNYKCRQLAWYYKNKGNKNNGV